MCIRAVSKMHADQLTQEVLAAAAAQLASEVAMDRTQRSRSKCSGSCHWDKNSCSL